MTEVEAKVSLKQATEEVETAIVEGVIDVVEAAEEKVDPRSKNDAKVSLQEATE